MYFDDFRHKQHLLLSVLTCPLRMEDSTESFKDLVARRLLAKAGDEVPGEQTIKDDKPENSNLLPKQTATATLTADFVKVEKNLASLGFFTPSSKRIRDAKAKTITFIKVIDGKKVE